MSASNDDLVRIRLISTLLKDLTGKYGGYEFVDGLSKPMLRREAERLSVITPVSFVGLEDDSTIENMWERKARERGNVDSDVVKEYKKRIKWENPTIPKQIESDNTQVKVDTLYTREELEKIADKYGIHGLRDIGDRLNVKGTSIRTLLDLILKAQGDVHPVG